MMHADRQIFDHDIICDLLNHGRACHVAINDEGAPYCLPMNYGFKINGEYLTLYFHCALTGKKLDLIACDPRVGFEISTFNEPEETGVHCQLDYCSLIGCGIASICQDTTECLEGLDLICQHYKKKVVDLLPASILNGMVILKIESNHFTAKADRPLNTAE